MRRASFADSQIRHNMKCKSVFTNVSEYRKCYISIAENSSNENDTRTGGGENKITYKTTTHARIEPFSKRRKFSLEVIRFAVVNGSRVPSKSEISLAGT